MVQTTYQDVNVLVKRVLHVVSHLQGYWTLWLPKSAMPSMLRPSFAFKSKEKQTMAFLYIKKLSGDVKPLLETAAKIAALAGAKLKGDEKSGTFSGKTVIGEISGVYEVKANILTITVKKKPFLVPEASIISALDKFFTS